MSAVWLMDRNVVRAPIQPARVGSDAAVSALRCALQAQLRDANSTAELRRAMRLVCAEARRAGVRVEQLLVILKTAWASVPEAWQSPRSGLRDDLLDQIVTMCIEEFYAGARLRAS